MAIYARRDKLLDWVRSIEAGEANHADQKRL
jgi:hypothetical protein